MEKQKRKSIPSKIRAELQKEINSKCPFCDNEDVGHFEVHHIDENPSNDDYRNLILLCPTCHSKITKGDKTPLDVMNKKVELMLNVEKSKNNKDSGQVITFNSKVDNAVLGNNNNVTIKKQSKKIIQKYPEGCIGYDSIKGNYVSHLIKRYNEYKENEVGKSQMNYAVFASQLKKKYKIPPTRTILNLPTHRFDELITDIQQRIDGTTFAKKLGRGHKNYSSFMEYQNEMNGVKNK